MIVVGSHAPMFDCTAVLHDELRELDWKQLHEDKVLVLLFTSIQIDPIKLNYLVELSKQKSQLDQRRARIAIVCRDDLHDIRMWLHRVMEEDNLDEFTLPIIVDSDDWIASLYDLLFPDGRTTWGKFVIDADGIVQQSTACSVPVEADADELFRCIEGLRATP